MLRTRPAICQTRLERPGRNFADWPARDGSGTLSPDPTRPRRTPVNEKLLWKLAGGAAAAVAAVAAKKAVDHTWRVATGGTPPPANPEDPDTTWQEALGWAVLSGTVIGVARLLAQRSAARMWRKRTGSLPPGLREVH
jgi:hypothetical protein